MTFGLWKYVALAGWGAALGMGGAYLWQRVHIDWLQNERAALVTEVATCRADTVLRNEAEKADDEASRDPIGDLDPRFLRPD